MTEGDLDAFLGAQPRRRLARWGMVVALLLAGLAAFWLLLRFVDGPDLPYYSVPLERGSLTPVMSASGTLHAEDEVSLRAPEGGVVHSLLGPGDGVVRAGQPIAMLDTAPLEAALASAEATRAAAEGTLAAAQADLDGARARMDRYDGVWRRSGGRVPSLNEMDGARAELSRTAAALASATAALAKARNDEALARRQLADATIRAPFDGVVVSRAVAPGQVVAPGTPLLALATGLDRLVVTVPLPAADAQRLASNARAHVLLSGMADKVRTARLVRIDPTDDVRGLDRLAVFALDPRRRATPPWCNCAQAWPRRWKSTCQRAKAYCWFPTRRWASRPKACRRAAARSTCCLVTTSHARWWWPPGQAMASAPKSSRAAWNRVCR
ncbi:efflux RND transporter periplasmic adaptor subunit [Novosphingobium pokkalii]|uniref:efflux RND transporter periplasmic adaptor subunit n=1 Tax=Novosphingobium pokkalii TaxID=1770194 RepID=UPI00363B110B